MIQALVFGPFTAVRAHVLPQYEWVTPAASTYFGLMPQTYFGALIEGI